MHVDRVAVIGSATIDRIEGPGIDALKMGGVATYAGLTFKRHGLSTTVVANIATSDAALCEIFREQHVDLFTGRTGATTLFVNHVEGDSRWQEMPVAASPITIESARVAMERVELVHFGPLHPADFDPDLLTFAVEHEKIVSLDVQGYVRRTDGGVVYSSVSKDLPQALEHADIIKSSREELQEILSAFAMDIQSLKAAYRLSEILVTDGRRGGYIVGDTDHVITYQARAFERLVDTTGAGDVFFAAYLVSRFDMGAACDHASFVAAQQISGEYISPISLNLPVDYRMRYAVARPGGQA